MQMSRIDHALIMYWSCRDHSEDHAGIRQTVINTKKAVGQPSETKELKLPWLRQHVKRKYYPLNVRRLTFAREAILKHGKRCTVRICQLTEWRLKNQSHKSCFSMNPSWIFKLSNSNSVLPGTESFPLLKKMKILK
jgi:hypothetical protein